MADENDDKPAAGADKPTPRRRPPRKAAPKTESAKPAASKRASRPTTTPAKKPAGKASAKRSTAETASTPPKTQTRTDRARSQLDKASDAVGGKRNLIAGGLVAAAAGAAAAALLSLRGSSVRSKPAKESTAHQPDGSDSSAQMEALIADENMIPETTPKA